MIIPLSQIIIRISLAALLGGVIGLERQLKGKIAGIRTTMVICTGAAVFMLVSQLCADRSGDQGRIAAQVVTGIGFLGAGVILHHRVNVSGLTTAATIFMTSAIGLATGGGYWSVAVAGSGVVIFTVWLLAIIETRFDTRRQTYHYSLQGPDASQLLQQIHSVLKPFRLEMIDVELRKQEAGYSIAFDVITNRRHGHQLLQQMLTLGNVTNVSLPEQTEHE